MFGEWGRAALEYNIPIGMNSKASHEEAVGLWENAYHSFSHVPQSTPCGGEAVKTQHWPRWVSSWVY